MRWRWQVGEREDFKGHREGDGGGGREGDQEEGVGDEGDGGDCFERWRLLFSVPRQAGGFYPPPLM